MSLRAQIRKALEGRDLDAMEMLELCPAANSIHQINNNLQQLLLAGKVVRVSTREYVRPRESGRTRPHEIRQKVIVWGLGDWPAPAAQIRPAENLPGWLGGRRAA